jgi:hypothetical protein
MPKENAFRFLMAKNKDEKIKSEFDAILCAYQGKNLSDNELESMLKEICLLAQEHGFHIIPEDLSEIQNNAEGNLSDEELSGVTGGIGRIYYNPNWWLSPYMYICEYAHDCKTFLDYYCQENTNCPDYEERIYGISPHKCSNCSHFQCEKVL